MTATQMYEQFRAHTGLFQQDEVLTSECALFLNAAQDHLWNRYYLPAISELQRGNQSYESTLSKQGILAPFKRTVTVQTNSDGFYPYPPTIAHVMSVAAIVSNGTSSRQVQVKWARDNEIASLYGNPLKAPTYNPDSNIDKYRLYWTQDSPSAPSAQTPSLGITVHPHRVYNIQIQVIQSPQRIQIQTTPLEAAEYQITPVIGADTNSIFPPSQHQEIVDEAVRLYRSSTGESDLAQIQNISSDTNQQNR